MFERFTNEARRIVILANQHARELRHNHIGTAHLLLALTDDDTGPVAKALMSLNVSPAELRTQLNVSDPSDGERPTGHIPFSERCKIALENGCAESVRHHQSAIDVTDLGMGLVQVDGGVAARALADFGLVPTQLQEQINRHRPPAPPAPTGPAAYTPVRRRGHRPQDVTSLHTDQVANISVTFIEDSENQALVRLPDGSQILVGYGYLASAPHDGPIRSDVFTYEIHVRFVGDRDGQALIRLPDRSDTVVEYAALTVTDDPTVKRNPDGSSTVGCSNCDWSHTYEQSREGSENAKAAFDSHHAEQHPDRFL